MARKEVADKDAVSNDQKGRLEAAEVRMIQLENWRDEANVSTDLCRAELLQNQKNLVGTLDKMMATLVCVVALTKVLNAVAAK